MAELDVICKIQVVKTFVIPKFMFRASLMCSTKKVMKELNSIICRFIWKGRDKIKRLALISDYKSGGLRMPHIKTLIDTQRIICLKKYIEDYDSPWKHFLSFFLSFLRTTVENFSYIVISILPTFQTTFPAFTENVSMSGPN